MTYDARETSIHGGSPWEAFWFSSVLQNYRYTSGDVPRTVLGQVYAPEAIKCSETSQDQEVGSGTLTVEVPLDCALAELLKGYLPPRPVSLIVYRGHDEEPEHVTFYTGVVASVERLEVCTLTVVPEQEALRRDLPAARFQRQCIRRLFSAKCGVDRNTHMLQATLAEAAGRVIKSAAFASRPNGFFTAGWIDVLGTSMSVASHVGDTLVLYFPLPGLVAGMQVLAFPGCDGTESICGGRFGNIDNYLGWAQMPGVNPFGAGGIK